MKKSNLNVTVFGIGAMGTLFGSRLSPLANVTLFGNWPEQIEILKRDGLTITRPDGSQSYHTLSVTNNLEQIPPADLALILVKSYQTDRAASQAATILRPDGLAITLQNGLGNLEKLSEAIGRERATLGVTTQGATVLSPGQLYHAGEGITHLALVPALEKRLEDVANLFNASGLETLLVDNADSLVWGKLTINAGINPLTALLEVPNGILVQEDSLRQIMIAAASEAAQVAGAQGIQLPFANVSDQAAKVSKATANNRSSMLQDISRSAPTEIEAISGAIVRFGKRFGIPTPVNECLLWAIKNKEAGRSGFNLELLDRLEVQLPGVVA